MADDGPHRPRAGHVGQTHGVRRSRQGARLRAPADPLPPHSAQPPRTGHRLHHADGPVGHADRGLP